ncbi:MAG TPA: penicillin-binding transpeptidase domain-containing protein, partial [Spirochaetota bacterium]|nr:penicillin-binding transpeptidase domain-containing protein [Spirochaetota bacterium]
KFPKNHKQKQREVLRKMVKAKVITEEEFEVTFNDFWLRYQNTSNSARGAFFNRDDQAPYFSDWVLQEIEKELPNYNIFKDGLTIYSTLDLKANKVAEELMKEILDKQQKIFEEEQLKNYNIIQNNYIDTISLLADTFSLTNIRVDRNKTKTQGLTLYSKEINHKINLVSQILGLNLLETTTNIVFEKENMSTNLMAQVQGAFIGVENETGQIVTMIGGKKFDPNNRFNYGMQSRRQPGSSFKPLIYSAALDSGMFNAASIIVDKPFVFTFDSTDPDDWYRPENYGGYYYGKVSLRRALRRSLNIPACQIFYAIGKNNKYKVPIDRAAMLLGINSQSEIDQRFKPEISTVLGTGSVSPIEMAMAFSIFANGGQKRIPNSILYVEDRDGRIIYEPWKDLQKYYRENSKKLQIISKENAFLVTNILRDTVHHPDGFLGGARARIIQEGKVFPDIELAAKTGTTQNWSDAWEVGYSPEISVAIWAGFNKYGLSLGYEQSGVSVLGKHFMEYMRQYHLGKGKLVFKNPGVGGVKVCRESGLLPGKDCKEESLYFEYFLPGTYPKTECNVCGQTKALEENVLEKFKNAYDKKYGDSDTKLYEDLNLNIDKSVIDMFKTKEEKFDFNNIDTNIDTTKTTLDDVNPETTKEKKEDIKNTEGGSETKNDPTSDNN